MNSGRKLLVLAGCMLCVACLVSCHRALVTPDSNPVYYSDSKYIQLLPTKAVSGPIDGAQRFEGTFGKTAFSGQVWVLANDTILSITFFNDFGTTIAELTYANDSVAFASSVLDVEKVKAEYILADYQACFYPFEVLKENFEKSGFEFREQLNLAGDSNSFERVLSENGNEILRITRKANEIDLVNTLRHYKYHITLGNE